MFGLLSLGVMAGIATDGTPYFDDPSQTHNQPHTQLGMNMDTPMPMRQDSALLQLISLEENHQRFPMSSVMESDMPSKEREI